MYFGRLEEPCTLRSPSGRLHPGRDPGTERRPPEREEKNVCVCEHSPPVFLKQEHCNLKLSGNAHRMKITTVFFAKSMEREREWEHERTASCLAKHGMMNVYYLHIFSLSSASLSFFLPLSFSFSILFPSVFFFLPFPFSFPFPFSCPLAFLFLSFSILFTFLFPFPFPGSFSCSFCPLFVSWHWLLCPPRCLTAWVAVSSLGWC